MSALYLALLAVLVSGLGGRDQATIAALSAARPGRASLLVVALVSAIGTAAIAAWLAIMISKQLHPDARLFFAAFALILAGVEALIFAPRSRMREPTDSLGAAAIVIFTSQALDAARFLVFAVAVATGATTLAAIGGAIGGAVLVWLGWAMPEFVLHAALRKVRRLLGLAMLFASGVIVLVASGIL